jgi:hypothetical protein
MDPEVLAELEAIDATLAGAAVDPQYAELAELSLLLAADRPQMSGDFARELDLRVARRFAPRPADARARRSRWTLRPALASGLAVGRAAVVAIGVVVENGGGSSSSFNGSGAVAGTAAARSSSSGTASSAAASGRLGPLTHSHARSPAEKLAPTLTTPGAANGSAAFAAPSTQQGLPAAPAPAPNGRRQIQSAQLDLTTSNARIDAVSQELFDVIGQENGIVKSSNITASSANGYAYFSLSIPSGNLSDALTRLSTLRYAKVVSRTDATQDVNNQYLSDVRRLADARALRTSLLKQLAAATTTEQVASLTARIHDAEASISSDEATLRGLQHQISYSSLTVEINAAPRPVPLGHSSHSSGGFTLGNAAHDALRVLTVAAGVALIVVAALIPLGLLVALGVWIGYWIRRRRREQALDAA